MKVAVHLLIFLTAILPTTQFSAQRWVDTTFPIETDFAVTYGEAVDFAGTPRMLAMDISYPVGDTVPECGRPLLVMVHGGGWLTGKRDDPNPTRIREDFARRGYTTASVSYRLGQFNTSSPVNCNVSDLFDVPWNCLNMTDTSEWYRAYFRGVQDVNGAIRYLVDNAGSYAIDPEKVFVVGESAGAFIAMGAGFLDDETEVPDGLTGAYPAAPRPNPIYEECVQRGGFAVDIASMDLSRPDLGSYKGTLNSPENTSYRILGVGNLYGGAFNNIFPANGPDDPPALYMFHQPCDLIVPFRYNRVFSGYQDCFFGGIANCGFIFRRPLVYGSAGIRDLLDTMAANGVAIPEYRFDRTDNQFGCLQQTTPGQSCHDLDNYSLRTSNMAAFFAAQIDTCQTVGLRPRSRSATRFRLYPNPLSNTERVNITGTFRRGDLIKLIDGKGRKVTQFKIANRTERVGLRPADLNLTAGIYYISIRSGDSLETKKLLITY